MSGVQKNWRFDKIPANFKILDDFDDGDYTGWTTSGNVTITAVTLDGIGYSVLLGDGSNDGIIAKESLAYPSYNDLYLVICFDKIAEYAIDNSGLQITIMDTGVLEISYVFGTNPTLGDINFTGVINNVFYAYVLPISQDFYDKNSVTLALDAIEIGTPGVPAQCYIDWIGIFRASAFSDDYCISCLCGQANDVDSGIRDTDSDDCYLKTTNSDLQITEDVVVDSNNAKLTIYGTLGEGMRLKVTISWEISSTPQTDKVLYAGVLPYAWDLAIECPSIDKVTNILIENILAP